jgi:hypothetical protein
MAADALAVGDDFESGTGIGACTCRVTLLVVVATSDSRILPSREGPLLPGASLLSAPREIAGLGSPSIPSEIQRLHRDLVGQEPDEFRRAYLTRLEEDRLVWAGTTVP